MLLLYILANNGIICFGDIKIAFSNIYNIISWYMEDPMKKKRYLILGFICAIIGMALISCSKDENPIYEDTSSSVDEEKIIVSDKEKRNEDSSTIRDIPSTELVKEFSIGWCLGNTLDATGGALLNTEMSWGNPKTKKEVFDKVKEAGFDIVRIPVTWEKHLGPEPDYKIDEAWLDRVNEVVDYAIDNNLYVILNMHHEEWHYPSYDNYEKAEKILTSVWEQIADRFKDYDEHLIFEGMNEPRMKGTSLEWTGGNEEARDVINKLNKAFVDTIRNSGGNNPYRHLMIPAYAASSDPKVWKDFELPDDDKIIVSIHAYTPYNFTINKNGTSNWSIDNPNDTIEIDNLIENIYNTFIINGHPVIIGEFGAMDKNNLSDRLAWAKYYVQKASEKGIPCLWWDNGAFSGSGELFGLLDRRQFEWVYPEIVEALMSGLKE